jgi:hypothetical protein
MGISNAPPAPHCEQIVIGLKPNFFQIYLKQIVELAVLGYSMVSQSFNRTQMRRGLVMSVWGVLVHLMHDVLS